MTVKIGELNPKDLNKCLEEVRDTYSAGINPDLIRKSFETDPVNAYKASKVLINQYFYSFGFIDAGNLHNAKITELMKAVEDNDLIKQAEIGKSLNLNDELLNQWVAAYNHLKNNNMISTAYPAGMMFEHIHSNNFLNINNDDAKILVYKELPEAVLLKTPINIALNDRIKRDVIVSSFNYKDKVEEIIRLLQAPLDYFKDFDKNIDSISMIIKNLDATIRDFPDFYEDPRGELTELVKLGFKQGTDIDKANKNFNMIRDKIDSLINDELKTIKGNNELTDKYLEFKEHLLNYRFDEAVSVPEVKKDIADKVKWLSAYKSEIEKYNNLYSSKGLLINKAKIILELKAFNDLMNSEPPAGDELMLEELLSPLKDELSTIDSLIPSGKLDNYNYENYLISLVAKGYITEKARDEHLKMREQEFIKDNFGGAVKKIYTKITGRTDYNEDVLKEFIHDLSSVSAFNKSIDESIEIKSPLFKVKDKVAGYINYAILKGFLDYEYGLTETSGLEVKVIDDYAFIYEKEAGEHIESGQTALIDTYKLQEKFYEKFEQNLKPVQVYEAPRIIMMKVRSPEKINKDLIKVLKGEWSSDELFKSAFIHEYRIIKQLNNEAPSTPPAPKKMITKIEEAEHDWDLI